MCVGVIYELSHSVSPKARGLGLGKELINRTMALAKEKECSHVYILATSIYSQAIFKKMKFEIMNEVYYNTYKNSDGSDFFNDLREHKSVQIVSYDLSNFVMSN